MDYKELIENLKAWDEEYISSACGESSLHCEHFCIPGKDCLVTQAVTAITDLLVRAEETEQKVNGMEQALSDASKVVKTMQGNTVPFYRQRAEEAEKGVDWLKKCVELAQRKEKETEARAEKAEHDMKRIVNQSSYPCEYCTKRKCSSTIRKRKCFDFEWNGGQKEE